MKTLEIEDYLVPHVHALLAKSAAQFDNAAEANGYGNLSATAAEVAEWQRKAAGLWALVRDLGGEYTKDEPLKIIVK